MNLPHILRQDYPNFEVIVVDDASTDETLEVLESISNEFKNLKIAMIQAKEPWMKGKKFALSSGIKMAVNDQILLTDADCKPASNSWITLMAGHFADGNQMVLGYSPFNKQNGLTGFLSSFETYITALQYFSFAAIGLPYMGVGRNLAYKKELYHKLNGFIATALTSGDDDLLVNQSSGIYKMASEVNPRSFMYTLPPRNLKEWIRQKIRHYSTGRYYKAKHQLLLSLLNGSHIGFYILLALILAGKAFILFAILAWIVRILIQYVVIGRSMLKLGEGKSLVVLPILDIFHACYLLFFLPAVVINYKITWK